MAVNPKIAEAIRALIEMLSRKPPIGQKSTGIVAGDIATNPATGKREAFGPGADISIEDIVNRTAQIEDLPGRRQGIPQAAHNQAIEDEIRALTAPEVLEAPGNGLNLAWDSMLVTISFKL